MIVYVCVACVVASLLASPTLTLADPLLSSKVMVSSHSMRVSWTMLGLEAIVMAVASVPSYVPAGIVIVRGVVKL